MLQVVRQSIIDRQCYQCPILVSMQRQRGKDSKTRRKSFVLRMEFQRHRQKQELQDGQSHIGGTRRKPQRHNLHKRNQDIQLIVRYLNFFSASKSVYSYRKSVIRGKKQMRYFGAASSYPRQCRKSTNDYLHLSMGT